MIQKLTTLLFILCLTLSVQAQKKPGFSKEEFRAKQEAYLTQKAELTAEEAGKFFRLESDKLDIEYLNRFKKILSPKKLFKLQRAEIKFHRDLLKIMHQPNKPDAHIK